MSYDGIDCSGLTVQELTYLVLSISREVYARRDVELTESQRSKFEDFSEAVCMLRRRVDSIQIVAK
jgi:hypothetical protein